MKSFETTLTARNPFDVWISIKLFSCIFYNGQNFWNICESIPLYIHPDRNQCEKMDLKLQKTPANFESKRLRCLRAIFDYKSYPTQIDSNTKIGWLICFRLCAHTCICLNRRRANCFSRVRSSVAIGGPTPGLRPRPMGAPMGCRKGGFRLAWRCSSVRWILMFHLFWLTA